MEDKKHLYEFSFFNTDSKEGFIFIIERSIEKALEWAYGKLKEEGYENHGLSKNTLISNDLRVHDDETVGTYEVIYP